MFASVIADDCFSTVGGEVCHDGYHGWYLYSAAVVLAVVIVMVIV